MPGRHHEDDTNLIVGSQLDDGMARPLVARSTGYRMDLESETFIVANPIRASDGHHGCGDGDDRTLPPRLAEPAAWSTKIANTHSNQAGKFYEEYTPALAHNSPVPAVASTVGSGGHSNNPLDETLVADPISAHEGKTYSHEGRNNFRMHNVVPAFTGVRRLTPLECERLQGFPDGWTDIRVRGKTIADAHRYRMLGNAVDTVCAQWLGHRLVVVDSLVE